jgi:hypothetical protein
MILFRILFYSFISFHHKLFTPGLESKNKKTSVYTDGIDIRYNDSIEYSNTFQENREKLGLYHFLKNNKISEIEKIKAIEKYDANNHSKYECDIFAGLLYDW